MGPLRHSAAALGAALALPVGAAVLAARTSARAGLRERLGAAPCGVAGAIWLHGASVGEIQAAARLLERLQARGSRVVASTLTPTGRDVLRRARPDVPCVLAPLDHPWCVERALSRARPAALVLIETELWPTWIAACARRDIPVLSLSARISDRSYPRYRALRALFARTFGRLAAVGARSPLDAERYAALGVPERRISVTGDLKLDAPGPVAPLAADLDAALAGNAVLVAGSTHAGEEEAALDAFAAVESGGARAVLVLAPRHLDRAEQVEALVRARGRRLCRRTRLAGALAPGEVLILDTLGELAALYGRAVSAFVGGTLAPVGGHNLLEPVFAGAPVCFGSHTEAVRHAEAPLLASGAGRRVDDARALAAVWSGDLLAPDAARARAAAGQRALRPHAGSTERSLALLDAVLARAAAEPRA